MGLEHIRRIGPRSPAVMAGAPSAAALDAADAAGWPGEAASPAAPDQPALFSSASCAAARRAPWVREMVKFRSDRPIQSARRSVGSRRRPFAEMRSSRITRAGWAFVAAMLLSAALWAIVLWIAFTARHAGGLLH